MGGCCYMSHCSSHSLIRHKRSHSCVWWLIQHVTLFNHSSIRSKRSHSCVCWLLQHVTVSHAAFSLSFSKKIAISDLTKHHRSPSTPPRSVCVDWFEISYLFLLFPSTVLLKQTPGLATNSPYALRKLPELQD